MVVRQLCVSAYASTCIDTCRLFLFFFLDAGFSKQTFYLECVLVYFEPDRHKDIH